MTHRAAQLGPKPRPGILDITPYQGGKSTASSDGPVYKLSSNESALGASDKAKAAYVEAQSTLHRYPDGGATALRTAIGALHGLDPDRIVCGAGSDELLQLLTRAYVGPGDNIVQSDHGFLVYALAAKSCGADVRFAAERDLRADFEAMLACVDGDTKIVFLANPNNPTGTYVADAEIRSFRERLPEDVLLVIDAAYAEYMDAPDYAPGDRLVEDFGNVVMTRTFSKIYGLGALRLGWAYCPAGIADVLNRIRGPFNVTAAALAAGEAALADQDFVTRNRRHNAEERDRLTQRLGGLGIEITPSAGNFLLLHFNPGDRRRDARSALAFLSARGVIVRDMTAYKLPDALRVSIGARDANDAFLAAIEEFFAQ